ncbi:hypothetical protein F0562_012250 [Nyssa sinensis]|uniref:Uncharacterized protein n=1 Tax=Nyssa sinensis TaxID=561372 RepID=A0A5J4ZX08_9ASTE|nr:hypothetical protein F0562_012250 [Nyssa sinensis]
MEKEREEEIVAAGAAVGRTAIAAEQWVLCTWSWHQPRVELFRYDDEKIAYDRRFIFDTDLVVKINEC